MHTWELVLVVVEDGGGDRECGGEEPLKTKDHPLSASSWRDVCKQRMRCAGCLITFDSSGPQTSWHSGSLKH